MTSSLAPIAVFAFNRPEHLSLTLDSLSKNLHAAESDVYLFLDGPRNEQDRLAQLEINRLISDHEKQKRFKSFKTIRALTNQGLAESIIRGVTEVVNQQGKIIVLEDDMITSVNFLKFMNDALNRYVSDERVISIHGYQLPLPEPMKQLFFLKGADCWGWATWARGWKLFNANGAQLLAEIRSQKREKEFNFNNTYPYVQMLKDQIVGKNNSWAIRWYASAFLKNKLTLYPAHSLVQNIGMDGSGTHCAPSSTRDVTFDQNEEFSFPDEVQHSPDAYKAYAQFFKSEQPPFKKVMIFKLKTAVKKILGVK